VICIDIPFFIALLSARVQGNIALLEHGKQGLLDRNTATPLGVIEMRSVGIALVRERE
jgi:hypothetical protein